MCWPVSLVTATAEDPVSAHTLLYPGSLRVVYHPELFPAVMRAALDCLCGVRGPEVLTEELPVEPLELDAMRGASLEQGWSSDSLDSAGEWADTPSSPGSSSVGCTPRSAGPRPSCTPPVLAPSLPFLFLLPLLPRA